VEHTCFTKTYAHYGLILSHKSKGNSNTELLHLQCFTTASLLTAHASCRASKGLSRNKSVRIFLIKQL